MPAIPARPSSFSPYREVVGTRAERHALARIYEKARTFVTDPGRMECVLEEPTIKATLTEVPEEPKTAPAHAASDYEAL